jgi:hypothetical protein
MHARDIEDKPLWREHEAAAWRLAPLVKKGLLHESVRGGWLGKEKWRALAEHIDTQLTRLLEHAPEGVGV